MTITFEIKNKKTLEKLLALLNVLDWFGGNISINSSKSSMADSQIPTSDNKMDILNYSSIEGIMPPSVNEVDYSAYYGITNSPLTIDDINRQLDEMRK